MNVVFACPTCECPARLSLDQACDWQCPQCDQRLHVESIAADLPACAICGTTDLYKKKAFPHALGMAILIVACVASVVTYMIYWKWMTWSILLGSALIDGLLYLLVGDAIVCYRCQAHYSGFEATDRHRPHELMIGERYRQERMRQEELKKQAR